MVEMLHIQYVNGKITSDETIPGVRRRGDEGERWRG
jgi:hypothetical protein